MGEGHSVVLFSNSFPNPQENLQFYLSDLFTECSFYLFPVVVERFFRGLFFLGIFMAIGFGIYEGFFAPKGEKGSGSFFPAEVFKEDEHLMYFFAFNAKQPVCWNVTSAYNLKHDS